MLTQSFNNGTRIQYDMADGRTLTMLKVRRRWCVYIVQVELLEAPENLGRDLLKRDAQRIFDENMADDLEAFVLDREYE